MQTRCPACHTLYRIDEDVLKRAGGQARCFRCDTVFDAYDNPADAVVEPEHSPQAVSTEEIAAAPAVEPPDDPDSDTFSELSALTELPAVPEAPEDTSFTDQPLDMSDLAETLRKSQDGETADTLDLSLEMDSEPTEPDTRNGDLRGGLPFVVPSDLPDIQPASHTVLSAEQALATPRPERRMRHLLPPIGAALLILLAMAQLAWFNIEQVLATPVGYSLTQGLCTLTGCTLPPRRAPSRFEVLDRHIGPDPELTGALAMRLNFRNEADFPQPLPDIQLSLYDSEEKLLARRRLHPHEYLFPAPSEDTLVEAGSTVMIDLRLEDPGRRASGFKIEFL